jgi:hypothetical protein
MRCNENDFGTDRFETVENLAVSLLHLIRLEAGVVDELNRD